MCMRCQHCCRHNVEEKYLQVTWQLLAAPYQRCRGLVEGTDGPANAPWAHDHCLLCW